MSRYNTQVLSNIRMLCRMQSIDEKALYERAKLILSIYREVCWSTIDRANDVYRRVLQSLIRLKNGLTAQGRHTDGVDDVLCKVISAKKRKLKIKYI